MKKIHRIKPIAILLAAALTLLACDSSTLIAALGPTETPTRAPRATFTPKPEFTETPETSPTPEATAPPNATATRTRVPATRAPTARPAATAIPAPAFEWKQASHGSQGKCNAGPSTFEIKGRVHDGTAYVGGVTVVLLDKAGKTVATGVSRYPIELNPEFGISCFEVRNIFSYQLDASSGWFNGPLIVRLVRSKTDLTPISTDASISFTSSGGRWYIDWTK